MDVSDLVSQFIIARFLPYNVRGPRISRGRALRIRYSGTVISSLLLALRSSLAKDGTDFILYELVDMMVLGELLLYIQSFI